MGLSQFGGRRDSRLLLGVSEARVLVRRGRVENGRSFCRCFLLRRICHLLVGRRRR